MTALPIAPTGVIDPGPPPVPSKTLSRWNQFLGSIAAGSSVQDAMLKHYITRADIEACARSDPAELQKYEDAKLAGMRLGWTTWDFDEIFEKVAAGEKIKDAIVKVKGVDPNGNGVHTKFLKLVVYDEQLAERWKRALETRSHLIPDEVLEIVDETDNDTLDGPKGGELPNMAAVNRAKLRAEMRMRLAGAWNKTYREKGDTNVAVQVVNHASTLEEARARARERTAQPKKITREVIEASFREVPPAADTSWMDDPNAT